MFEEASSAPVVEPTPAERLKYRLGLSIPERYRGWVERDVNSKRFLWWHVAHLWIGAAIATGLARLVVDDYNPIPFLIGWAVATFAQMTVFAGYNRRKFLRYHEKRWARTRERDVTPDFRRVG